MEPVTKKRRGLSLAAVLILLFAAVTLVNVLRARFAKEAQEGGEEVIPVQVVEARRSTLQWILDRTGDLHSALEVMVYPKVPGKILETLTVEKGDTVAEGDLLGRLETREVEARIQEVRASLAAARADLDLAEKDRTRIRNLFEKDAVSRQRLETIEARYLSARAGVEGIRATLRRLRVLRRDHHLIAPISGLISARYLDRGALSDPAHPVLRISSQKALKIVAAVPEQDFPRLRKGLAVEIRVDAYPDKTFTGAISVINPTIDPATRTGEVEVHLENPDMLLRSGMFAHLRIHLGQREGVVVPRDTLKTDPGTGRFYLFVVRDGRAELRNLKIGGSRENDVEVLEGVSAGEAVVIKGQNRLKHGAPVTIEKAGGPSASRERFEGTV